MTHQRLAVLGAALLLFPGCNLATEPTPEEAVADLELFELKISEVVAGASCSAPPCLSVTWGMRNAGEQTVELPHDVSGPGSYFLDFVIEMEDGRTIWRQSSFYVRNSVPWPPLILAPGERHEGTYVWSSRDRRPLDLRDKSLSGLTVRLRPELTWQEDQVTRIVLKTGEWQTVRLSDSATPTSSGR